MHKPAYLGLFGAVLLNSCQTLSKQDSCQTLSKDQLLEKFNVSKKLYLSRVSYDATGKSRRNFSSPRKVVIVPSIYDNAEEMIIAAQCGKVTAFGDIQNKASAVYLFECSDCLIWFDKNFQVLNFKAEPDIEEKLETNAKKLIIEIAKEESGWLLK